MGLSLRSGRFFNEHDRLNSEPVIVVDEVLAKQAFGGKDALGRNLWIPDFGNAPFRIVGVVSHVRHWGLAADDQAQVRAQIYYPFAQVPDNLVHRWSELMSITVRTSTPPFGLVQSMRSDLRGVSGDQVLYQVRTMEQLTRATLERQRFLLLLFGIFAGLAVMLACIGLYGVLTYLMGQRVPELGLRLALGASPIGVQWLVLLESLRVIFIRLSIGAAAALASPPVIVRPR